MFRNSLYNAFGGVTRILITSLTIPFLVRSLGIEEYGLFVLTFTVVGIVTLAESGLANATTVFVAKDLGSNDFVGLVQTIFVTFGSMLILSTLAAISLWNSSDFIALILNVDYEHKSTIATSLKMAGFIVWAKMIQQMLVGLLQAHEKYAFLNAMSTIHSLLTNLGMLLVVWLGGKTCSLVAWQLAINMLSLFIHGFISNQVLCKYQLPNLSWDRKKWLDITAYSITTWFGSLGGVLFGHFDKIIISFTLGASSLGTYAFIISVASQINTFSAICIQPILPNISNSLADSKNSIEEDIKFALQINTVVSLGMGSALFTIAPFIVSFGLTGSREYILIFQIAILIYSLYSCNTVGYFVLLATKATKEYVKILLMSGITSLLLIYLGSKYWGLPGAVLGNSGYFLIWLFTLVGMKKINIPMSNLIPWIKWPFSWIAILTLIIYFVTKSESYLLAIFTYLLGISPVIIWLLNEYKLFAEVRKSYIK
jgi:O-antigen/teichoic acid export membrane protein